MKGGDWSATNSGIFTSLVFPLAKAIRAAQRNHVGVAEVSHRGKRTGFVCFNLIVPVVVTSAEVIVVDTTSRESVCVATELDDGPTTT